MPAALIAIDQGTTSTRAIVFDAELRPLASAQQELRQIYPAPGEVEHDPEEIWSAVVAAMRAAMAQARIGAKDVAGIGITNQRETVVIWDRQSGRPIHHAIVWQDRRTADYCEALRRDGHEADIARKTGQSREQRIAADGENTSEHQPLLQHAAVRAKRRIRMTARRARPR